MSEVRQPVPGDTVTFVDEHAVEHNALLTAVHGDACTRKQEVDGTLEEYEYQPSVNLLYVTSDDKKHDQYGNQIERESSVVNKCHQGAHGMYWKWS